MKNFTKELKNILTEEYGGTPILSPDEVRGRANTTVILTNQAPKELLALAGPSREAILLNFKPLMITFPYQKGVYKVQPDDIVFENHHSGRDITEAGSEETSYEKFFAAAMKKFGVSSPIELSPEDTKKFFNYVDKNWDAEEESDGSKNEISLDEKKNKARQRMIQRQRDKKKREKGQRQRAKEAERRRQEQQRDREDKQREREREQDKARREREKQQQKPADDKPKSEDPENKPETEKKPEAKKKPKKKGFLDKVKQRISKASDYDTKTQLIDDPVPTK